MKVYHRAETLNKYREEVSFMGYRPQTKSSRSAGRRYQKTQHDKAKAKAQRHRSVERYLEEEHVPTVEEAAEKTLGRLQSLGNQVFALSPFSRYFDDWLLNLREVLSEFESSPAMNVDDAFVKESQRVLVDVERELAKRRLEEAELERVARSLSDNNHLLLRIDTEYADATRELSLKRDNEVKRLTRLVQDLEEELERIENMKTGVLGLFSMRAKGKKRAETTQRLCSTKSELELVLQNFTVEQEKLHDEYEKRKQVVVEQVQRLEKEMDKVDIDGSLEARRVACEALANAVNALLQRMVK